MADSSEYTWCGWTEDQWAVAKAVSGLNAEPTIRGCLELKHWWRSHRTDQPTTTPVIIGVDRPQPDYGWVYQVIQTIPFRQRF